MATDLSPGAELVQVRTTGFAEWNRYAAVNDEFIPMHMDDDAGRAQGFPGAIGMGNLIWSYVHAMLRAAMGEGGRIEAVSARYWQPNLRNSTLTLRAKVVEASLDGEATRATLELLAEDEAQRRLMTGQAIVRVMNGASS